MNIEFYKHSLGDDEKRKVLECLDGLFLTTGSYVAEFEQEFARYLELPFCVGLTSCTAALHLSLLALGIGTGDEVITTPLTFIATATAILHTGACPVFIDVDPDTGLLDPEQIAQAVTERTKAIIPVHLYGHMCDMKALSDRAQHHNLAIIEDAAHCLEGGRDGIRPGQVSDLACFSFYATKNITSGEGGAVVCRNREMAERVRLLRQHGISKEAADRYSGPYQHWDMITLGWKYNMDNIQAALLLPQLPKIETRWLRRRERFDYYLDKLKSIPGIKMPRLGPAVKHGYHLLTIWVEPTRRDDILAELGARGVGVAVNYRAIHLLTYFRQRFGFVPGSFPHAEKIGHSTISLPFYADIAFEEIDRVVSILQEICSV
ncbi:DegT/DnrJ/EryC1/StrS family aminotransferase [bacterium]|nr:DegT/DnrJ/EryC1/StrS family aminotransferase [bacterium]